MESKLLLVAIAVTSPVVGYMMLFLMLRIVQWDPKNDWQEAAQLMAGCIFITIFGLAIAATALAIMALI